MTSLYRTASATIRWVTLPDAGHQLREYGMKKAEDVSVAIGWLAHLVHRTGCELGIPLRYPIRLLGSASTILDPSKEPREEYPLHMPKVLGLEVNHVLCKKNNVFTSRDAAGQHLK